MAGKFGEDWGLTASADTLEGPVEDLCSNFMDKAPESFFRRIEPEEQNAVAPRIALGDQAGDALP